MLGRGVCAKREVCRYARWTEGFGLKVKSAAGYGEYVPYDTAGIGLCSEWMGMYVEFGTGFCSFPLASRPWNAIRLQEDYGRPGGSRGDAMRRGRSSRLVQKQPGLGWAGQGLEGLAPGLWAPALADWTEMEGEGVGGNTSVGKGGTWAKYCVGDATWTLGKPNRQQRSVG